MKRRRDWREDWRPFAIAFGVMVLFAVLTGVGLILHTELVNTSLKARLEASRRAINR